MGLQPALHRPFPWPDIRPLDDFVPETRSRGTKPSA